jgi:hypothetical protein
MFNSLFVEGFTITTSVVWLCYKSPSLFQHGRSEISTCVQVSIQGKTTMTNKRITNTRTKMSTFGTNLGSIVRFNLNKLNSLSFSFVLDKTLQLKKTPIANPIVHSPSEISFSNPLKVFHNNLISIKIGNDCLADVMINPSHKPSLFSRNLFQESSGTSSAFALEFTSQEFEFPFNLFDLRRVEELPVRSNSEIINPQVHTQNSLRNRALGRKFLGECEKEEIFTFRINPQKDFINLPTKIIFKTIRNSEWNFNSSIYCGDAQNIILEREASWIIVSNRTEFNNGFIFRFLNHSTSLFNTSNRQLSRKSKFFQSQINKWMKLDIIHNSHLPSLINTELQSFFIDSNSSNNLFSWFNSNLSCCSVSHRLSTNLDFKYLSEVRFT